jgi:hypothetical protein
MAISVHCKLGLNIRDGPLAGRGSHFGNRRFVSRGTS